MDKLSLTSKNVKSFGVRLSPIVGFLALTRRNLRKAKYDETNVLILGLLFACYIVCVLKT